MKPTSNDFITHKQWRELQRLLDQQERLERRRFLELMQEERRRKISEQRPLPPKLKPKSPEELESEIESNKFADWLYNQGGGVTRREIDRGEEIHQELTYWDDD